MKTKKILVIEDNVTFLKTLKNVLKTNGYVVEIATTGAEGIQKAYEYSPDLILCDINMRPIDGFQVYNVLKESSLTKRIPFIFITGRSGLNDIRFGLELGADDYIVKPFQNEDLLKSIKIRLEKYDYLVNIGRSKYEAFVEYSPNGIFLFDGITIYEANQAFLNIIGCKAEDLTSISFKKIIETNNYKSIEDKINRSVSGVLDNFQEKVKIKNVDGIIDDYVLYVAPSLKYNGFSLLTGLLLPAKSVRKSSNHVEYKKLVHILEEEDIRVTETLSERLQEEFNSRKVSGSDQTGFVDTLIPEIELSKRELEVLKLSCKGLPIKCIAEKLCISDRTVESHRASLMEKTESKNIVEVIIYALKNNLVEI